MIFCEPRLQRWVTQAKMLQAKVLHAALLERVHGASYRERGRSCGNMRSLEALSVVVKLQACTKMPPEQENVKMRMIQVRGWKLAGMPRCCTLCLDDCNCC